MTSSAILTEELPRALVTEEGPFSSASRPMTEECPISAHPQAGKGPRTARGAVPNSRHGRVRRRVPTTRQLCRDAVPTLPMSGGAVSGWRLGILRDRGALGEPRPTLIASLWSTGPLGLRASSVRPLSPCQLASMSPRASACPHVTVPTCPCWGSPQPILPHHHHRRGIEFAIAHELATHGLAGDLV